VPLYLVSGVFAPGLDLPRWLHDVAEAFPVEHLTHALHQAFDPGADSPFDLRDLAVLALWGAGGLVLALRRFTWTPTTTTWKGGSCCTSVGSPSSSSPSGGSATRS
jgi:ABC-2 type transport system permease protein